MAVTGAPRACRSSRDLYRLTFMTLGCNSRVRSPVRAAISLGVVASGQRTIPRGINGLLPLVGAPYLRKHERKVYLLGQVDLGLLPTLSAYLQAACCCCCSSSGFGITSAVDVMSGEVRNAVSVSAAPCSITEIGERMFSSSPVMVVRGDPLDPKNWVSLS